MGFIRPNPTAPWVYVVDRLRLRRPRLSAFTHYPCILPEETIVQLGIELRVTSSSTMGGVMLLGMVLYMMTSRTLPRLSRYGTALVPSIETEVKLCYVVYRRSFFVNPSGAQLYACVGGPRVGSSWAFFRSTA